ncbi:MAG: DsbA family protein [Candidatus Manganitrophus sp. SA1]|nr:DsbA family protein [Candidatus Manganitrophus morganii]
MAAEPQIRIDVWSDYVCPFCYLEVPVLDRLQEAFGPALQIDWHAFELRPEPIPTLDPAGDYLKTTWARSVYPMAERRGMALQLPPVQPRSRKALEAAAHARAEGSFDPMHRAIFRAFFEEGRDIAQMEVLLEIAASAGLDAESLRHALETNRHTKAVLEEEHLAQELGISAVPTMLLRREDAPLHDATGLRGALAYEQVHAVAESLLRGEEPFMTASG